MQTAMLIPEAVKLKKKRWAIVYPNYEYGQSATASFKKLLAKAQPGVQFVAEQAPPLGKIDAGAVVQALVDAKPDAIFSLAVRRRPAEVRARGQHARPVQEHGGVQPARAASPSTSIRSRTRRRTAGASPAIRGARSRRRRTRSSSTPTSKRWKDYPRLGSVVGYTAMYTGGQRACARRAATDTEKLIAAMKGLEMGTPVRPDRLAGRSTTSPPWAPTSGSSRNKGGKGVMVNWRFADGANFLPPFEEVKVCSGKSRLSQWALVVSPHPVPQRTGGRLLAVPGGRRPVPDLRRHPDRQLRPRLALHAGDVPGGLAAPSGSASGPRCRWRRSAVGAVRRAGRDAAAAEDLQGARAAAAARDLRAACWSIKDFALWAWGPEDLLGPRAPGFAGAVEIAGRRFPAVRPAADRARPAGAGCSLAAAHAHALGHPGARRDRGPRDGRRARRQPALAVHRRVRAGRRCSRAWAARCRSRASRPTSTWTCR